MAVLSNKDIIEENRFERAVNKFATKKFKDCLKIFDDLLMMNANNTIVCGLHNCLSPKGNSHNCIPCNINDIFLMSYRFLRNRKNNSKIPYDYNTYIMCLHGASAILREVHSLMVNETPDKCREIFNDRFKTFIKIDRWANFIKHPKNFAILTHHPLYNFENSGIIYSNFDYSFGDKFVLEYYGGKGAENKRDKLINELSGKGRIMITLPDVSELTLSISDELRYFINLIENNSEYQHILKDKSVIDNFFEL